MPEGARFTSFKISDKGDEEIAGFISKDLDDKTIEHLYIVLHGKLRDGNTYWETLKDVISEAKEANATGSDRKMAVLAPQFFSTKYNIGQYKKNQLAWDDLNAWQPGGQANHPSNTTLTPFDVLDGLVKLHSNKEQYPSLTNVTVVGHGGGGQLAQRYAAVGNDAPDNVHIRYIHGDPSSCLYFTEHRPIISNNDTSIEKCKDYNTWRYGFHKFPGTGGKRKTPKEYFKQYLSRDVVSIVGLQDTANAGDTSCIGKLQGGDHRRARNLIWFRYVTTPLRAQMKTWMDSPVPLRIFRIGAMRWMERVVCGWLLWRKRLIMRRCYFRVILGVRRCFMIVILMRAGVLVRMTATRCI